MDRYRGASYIMERMAHWLSPLGGMTMSADEIGLTGLWFDGQKNFAEAISPDTLEEPSYPVFRQTVEWLSVYFGGSDPGFTPPLHLKGTPFRKAVWSVLLSIPYGETRTYGEVARAVSAAAGSIHVSPRAAGGAAGHNPISLIVPCHRVIGASGGLTGYAGGLERKARLLAMEGISLYKR